MPMSSTAFIAGLFGFLGAAVAIVGLFIAGIIVAVVIAFIVTFISGIAGRIKRLFSKGE